MESELRLCVKLSRKVNLGNYQSADVDMIVSGIAPSTTEEEIDALVTGQGALAYTRLASAIKAKVEAILKT